MIAGVRMRHRERKADRDGGIDRVAALLQDLDADAGGALLLRHHHAVLARPTGRTMPPSGSPAPCILRACAGHATKDKRAIDSRKAAHCQPCSSAGI